MKLLHSRNETLNVISLFRATLRGVIGGDRVGDRQDILESSDVLFITRKVRHVELVNLILTPAAPFLRFSCPME